ncbi:MAG TPA: hypothetical protein VFJ94_03190 [Intrasporangium sp.]|uniref:hypothetical protein n=1 Tax=Intrasporangium sp. TaxID=1925024 RepID=UPI002D77E6D1|nr:hypothetical protein [Intrasporangium sp.]HET7397505.1 hypothetical protein [Intrasporangium sp.]
MHGVGPGSVLAGRYAVALRTSEGTFHERWRATDTTLERDVVLVCFSTDSQVAAATLDAARRAAGVEDQRLVRVLDVGSDGGVSFIVEEPLTGGQPLSHLLQGGGLPADEVRRLVGESATALEKARHRGLHHLALSPSSLVRMPGGEVKVRGLATEAALTDTEIASDGRASRVDAVGLVKLAYAGLTGRWPQAVSERGRSPQRVGLEPAPSIVGGVAAPSEIAVGVPADLDLLCRLTLNEDSGPVSPGDLAVQIAPWPAGPPTSEASAGIGLRATARPAEPTLAVPPPGATRVLPVVGASAAGGAATASAPTGPAEHPEKHPGAAIAAAGAAAGAAAAGVAGAIGDKVGSFARAAADRAAARAAERRAVHDRFDGEDIALTDALEESPVEELEPPVPLIAAPAPEGPSGTQSRIALAIVAALVLVALVIGVQNVTRIGQHDPTGAARPTVTVTSPRPTTTPVPSTTTPAPPASTPPAGPIAVVSAKGFDPQEDNTEADGIAPLAVDGKPETVWRSRWYGTDTYNGKKAGVGLVLDLGSAATIREVLLTLPAPQDVTVYAADTASLEGAQQVGATTGKAGPVTLTAPPGLKPATKLLVWVTKPAPAESANHFRAQIADVAVR